MRVALCQVNPTLGDFKENAKKIIQMAEKAKSEKCDIALFCEMTLFGYHPCDLLERKSVVQEQLKELEDLIAKLPQGIVCLLGAVQLNPGRGKAYFNSALQVLNNKVIKVFNKQLLPVYDVFDDSRHFTPGHIKENILEINGKKVLVLICEDMWGWDPIHDINPIEKMKPGDVDFVLNLSASPLTPNKRELRMEMAQKTANHLRVPLAYVNMVGAQDELVFDGGSFAISSNGEVISSAEYFSEDFACVDLASGQGEKKAHNYSLIEYTKQALLLGIRDFYRKVGFRHIHLGLSGGIDSAVVAALAAEAVGPENLTLLGLPSKFNAEESLQLAQQLADNLGCEFNVIPIQEDFETIIQSYEKAFGPKEFSLIHENIQARIRGLLLMAFANEHHSLLLTTGNKSEYATGYTTLYGDMCGGLAVIGDLLKREVYDLARHFNRNKEVIPKRIIDRPPSAELRPGQKDQDSLPPYDQLDDAVNHLVSLKNPAKTDLEKWVVNKLMVSEFKRWQAPPILKVSAHAFGQGRRMPIAHRARI